MTTDDQVNALAAAIKVLASNVSAEVRTQVDAVLVDQIDEQLVDDILGAVATELAAQSTDFDPMDPNPPGPDFEALKAAVRAVFQERTAE